MHQSFTEYFRMFLERKVFSENIKLFNELTQQLKDQIDAELEISNESEFIVDFDEDHPIKIYFRDFTPEGFETDDAIYYPPTESIFVFLKNAFEKIKDNRFNIVKEFPPQLRDIIIHELTHAYEHIIREFTPEQVKAYNKKAMAYNRKRKLKKTDPKYRKLNQYSVAHFTGPEDETIENKNQRYINNLAEMNAHLNQWVSREYNDNKQIKQQLKRGNLNNAVQLLIQKIKREPQFKNLFKQNKKWFYKTIYTTLDQLMN